MRVAAGTVGIANGRVLLPGLHMRRPFERVVSLPLSGRLDGIEVDRTTEEGSTLRVRVSFGYRLDPAALPAVASALSESGLPGLASARVRAAIDPLPSAVLPSFAVESGNVSLSRPAAQAIEAGLRSAGLVPSALAARIGPPESFATESMPATSGAPGLRLLLIGLDGADWDTLGPLLRAGRLPNLARLIEAGVWGPLRSYDPMISPLLWTTMVTGVGPDVHGVADFQAVDESTGRRVPISGRFRRVKALWNILSDAHKSSAFVAWWASYPAEPVDGYQVSNLVVFQTLRPRAPGVPLPPGMTWPAEYFDAVAPALSTAAALTYEEVEPILHVGRDEFDAALREVLQPPPADEEEKANRRLAQRPVPLAISILAGSKNYAAIAADLAAKRPDLTAVYFEGIDMMGHRFQHCMPPRMSLCPTEDFPRYRDAVTGFYVRQDALIGRIVAAAGPGATVLVVSDHGFKTGEGRPAVLPYTTEQPVEWHREDGVFVLSGPGARPGRLAPGATLFDIAPTLLYLLGLPASDDMPGRVLLEAIDPEFTRRHPVGTIPSYERIGAPRPQTVVAEAGPDARRAEEELLDNLRALGYIGGDPAGGAHAEREEPAPIVGTGAAGGGAATGTGAVAPPAPRTSTARNGAPAGTATQVFYHRNLATYFMKRRDYTPAVEQLRLANERQRLPKNYQLLSEAYLGTGRPDLALAALEEGLRTMEGMDAEAVLWMTQIALGEGGGGRAIAEDILRRYGPRVAARPGLADAISGLLAENSGDTQEAAHLYRRALEADPTRVMVAQRLFALTPPGARAALGPLLARALTSDPRIDEYHNLMGILLAEQGRADASLREFQRAAELDPDNPRFLANLGGAWAQGGHWQDAAAAYERACALSPAPALYLKLGSVYRRLERPERALAAFRRARELGDDGSAPYLGMALAEAEMNRTTRAIDLVKEGLGRHPDDAALRSLYDDLVRRTRSPGSPPGPPG